MMQRHKLDTVQQDQEIVTFTLVIDYPYDYFVEQRCDPTKPFAKMQLHFIKREDFFKYIVNSIPLIQLVERKLEAISRELVFNAA